MSKTESESDLKTDVGAADDKVDTKSELSAPEDHLMSSETLRESPLQWPERFPGMDEFVNMSDTPIHTPNVESNLTSDDMAKMSELASMSPDQLITKIKSMHDEIYQLGLREAKEMTRGKLLGIFGRGSTKRKT